MVINQKMLISSHLDVFGWVFESKKEVSRGLCLLSHKLQAIRKLLFLPIGQQVPLGDVQMESLHSPWRHGGRRLWRRPATA